MRGRSGLFLCLIIKFPRDVSSLKALCDMSPCQYVVRSVGQTIAKCAPGWVA